MNIAVLMLNAGRGSGEVARQHAQELIGMGHGIVFMYPRMAEGVPGANNRAVVLHDEVLPVHEYLPPAGARQRVVSEMSAEEAEVYTSDYERALDGAVDTVDIIIGHHGDLAAVAVHRVARRRHKPFVLFLHGTGIEPRKLGRFDPGVWAQVEQAITAADGLIVTTRYVCDELVRSLVDVPLERFLMLPGGVDTAKFHPGNDPDGSYGISRRYVIAPGPLIHSKGPQNVVEASRRYADVAPTIFIGDGPLRTELERTLGNRGRFLGFVSDEHKTALINGASVLTAAPEKKEHFGVIYIEALAAGAVPVAYEGGGVGSILTPEVGVLTRRDPQALGDAIREVLVDDERRRRMAVAARERALAHFDAQMLARRLETWLLAVLGR